MAKLMVMKTIYGGEEGMFYEEEDIRQACKEAGCPDWIIDDCISGMKDGEEGCRTCMAMLLDAGKEPEYRELVEEIE